MSADFRIALTLPVSIAEVAGVTFSDSDSAPVQKVLNPDPDPGLAFLQFWESDSCSDSGYIQPSNHSLPMFLPKKWPHRLLLLPKWKSDSGSGSGFHKFLTPGPDLGPKEKCRILPVSTPALRIRSHLVHWHWGKERFSGEAGKLVKSHNHVAREIGCSQGAFGPWSPKYNLPSILLFTKKVVLRLSEHGGKKRKNNRGPQNFPHRGSQIAKTTTARSAV